MESTVGAFAPCVLQVIFGICQADFYWPMTVGLAMLIKIGLTSGRDGAGGTVRMKGRKMEKLSEGPHVSTWLCGCAARPGYKPAAFRLQFVTGLGLTDYVYINL